MSEADIPKSRGAAAVARYALAVVSVGVALVATMFLQPNELVAPLFFLAIILTAWFGGMGPGLLAALMSTLCIDFFFLAPVHNLKVQLANIPHLLVFFISAVLVSSWSAVRRHAETLLRRARDEQEVKIQERTADLKQANEKLQVEITERQRAEETLRQRADLLDLTHDTIFARDMNDVITYWNHGAEELYGWKKEEAVGKVSHELTQTIFPAPLEDINETLLRTGRWEGELKHTRRDGTHVVVASRWSLQRNEHGMPHAILETNNDITEHKQAEEALQKTQAELAHVTRVTTMGELTSSIAHEVNQPLAAIVTNGNACLRWLSNDPPNVEEARQNLLRMVKDSHRASEVVARIRAFFRKTAPERVRVNINKLIEDVIGMVPAELRRNRVQVRTELADDLPPVVGDQIQLQQVVLNLVINAIEAMSNVRGPRELLIKSRRYEAGSVIVCVQDSGVGFDEQNASQIFNAFFTTKPKGLGMGLSISRNAIEAYGGRLWATTNDGGGATFQFTLPRSDGSVAEKPQRSST
jgi:two-component system, LuxR family, sensor kinase FixL